MARMDKKRMKEMAIECSAVFLSIDLKDRRRLPIFIREVRWLIVVTRYLGERHNRIVNGGWYLRDREREKCCCLISNEKRFVTCFTRLNDDDHLR